MRKVQIRFRLAVVLAACTCVASAAFAKAPVGRYAVDAASDTVHDTWSNLTWQRTVDAGTYAWSSTAASGSAQAYCQALGQSGGGWRLPGITELETLLDRQESSPPIDPTAFPATPTAAFWSATPSKGWGWAVNFDAGNSFIVSPEHTYSVRCVR